MSDMLAIGASGLRAYQAALTPCPKISRTPAPPAIRAAPPTSREVASIGGISAQSIGSGEGAAVVGVHARAATCSSAAEVLPVGRRSRQDRRPASSWLDRIETSLSGSVLGDAADLASSPRPTTLAGRSRPRPRRARRCSKRRSASPARSARPARRSTASPADLDATTRDTVSSLNSLAADARPDQRGARPRRRRAPAATPRCSTSATRLLEAMSALTDVNVSYDNAGRATVHVGGSGGPVLVDGETGATVDYVAQRRGHDRVSRADRRDRDRR